MSSKNGIPKWIIYTSSFISFLGLFVGVSLYFMPEPFIDNVDFSAKGVSFLLQMWAARQVAIAFVIAYTLVKSSTRMLKTALLVYSVMNVQDSVIGIINNDLGLAFGAGFFFLLSLSMVVALTKDHSHLNTSK